MDLKSTLETRHSEKSGKDYQVIVIKLTDNYEKVVFLENSELELVKLSNLLKNNK